MVAFEETMRRGDRAALAALGEFFMGEGKVNEALDRISSRLEMHGIPYAIVGGMAIYKYGYERSTSDVDLLVTADGLKRVHEKLEGLGYIPPFTGSKNLRDTDTGVKIEFLVTGGFPGDGKPKPVSFPDPDKCSHVIDGIRYVTLETLIELKLASGMSNLLRAKDIGDAVELVKANKLGEDFAQKLNPYVREKFLEICRAVQNDPNPQD